MKKFNEFQKATIISALGMYGKALCAEIAAVEATGKTPFFTEEFIAMQIKDIIALVSDNTKK